MSSKSDDDNTTGGSKGSPLPVTKSINPKESDTRGKENDDDDHEKVKVANSTDSSGEEGASSTVKRITRQSMRTHEIDQQREKFLSMSLESKRKLYRNKFTTLKDIQTWPEYYHYMLKVNSKTVKQNAVSDTEEQVDIREDLNKKLSIFQGDITTLEIDAIANAANESLLGGGGVDGAIHRAAGSDLLAECENLNGCTPGDAKITCGYKLPAKYVIHTVGPRGEYPKVLKNCYIRCLELLKKHQLTTIAFPCISTGIFGYPNSKAAKVVLKTLRSWLEKDEYAVNVERIILCLFLKVDIDVYKKLLPVYFPVACVDANVNQKSSIKSEEHKETSSPEQTVSDDDEEETKENKKETNSASLVPNPKE